MLEGELIRERKRLIGILIKARESLVDAPVGCLKVWDSKNGEVQCYVRDLEGNWRYLKKADSEFASRLAQRAYDEKVVASIETSVKAIDRLLKVRGFRFAKDESAKAGIVKRENVSLADGLPIVGGSGDYQAELSANRQMNEALLSFDGLTLGELDPVVRVYERMSRGRRRLVAPYVKPDGEFVAAWQSSQFEPMPFEPGAPCYQTERGERVRSKSEIIIANALSSAGVPYHYEKPLRLRDGRVLRPDFTVLNVRTRRQFIWEHFGMMDDARYSASQCRKMTAYMRNCIFPGEKLIFTQETSRDPLDTSLVAQVIKHYLK